MSGNATHVFQQLPPELILHVAGFLDLTSLCQLRATSVRLAEVLVEAKTYACRFEEVRVRMYEREHSKNRVSIPIRSTIEAFRRVLSTLHPRLNQRLHEVTFLLGPWVDDESVRHVQAALRSVFTLLGSARNGHLRLRISRGGDRGRLPDPDRRDAALSLPELVFQELLWTSASELVQFHDLLVNLDTKVGPSYLERCESLVASTPLDRGLRTLRQLHFNIPPTPRNPDDSYKTQVNDSYRAMCHYAGIISLCPRLEKLNVTLDNEFHDGIATEIESYVLNRILQDSTLNSLRHLRLSGAASHPCRCTSETVVRFLENCPLLETLALSDIVLRGPWDDVFEWIASGKARLARYSFQRLYFWVPSSEKSERANIQQIYFVVDGGRIRGGSHITGDTRRPLRFWSQPAGTDFVRLHCSSTMTELMTSWTRNDLAALSEGSLPQNLCRTP